MEIRQLHPQAHIIWKNIGETPLEALERFRVNQGVGSDVPMTYAGRLDPMAEGELLILSREECKKKDEYLKFDKEYEVEIVFGVETDTYDALGLVVPNFVAGTTSTGARSISSLLKSDNKVVTFPVTLKQTYPPYSSRTVNGRQLHELARAGELPDPEDMPSQTVTLHLGEVLSRGTVTATDLFEKITHSISLVKGDFRQPEILNQWRTTLNNPSEKFETLKIRIQCSSGTYMRSLAHELGKEKGTGAFALAIKRTRILI